MSIMHNGEKVLNNLTTVPITQTINASSTDTQVASAKAVYDTTSKFLKTYTSIEQLGLTSGSETIEDIAKNMGSFTRLITIIEGGISIYPYMNGTLIVEKLNPYRVHFKFCKDEAPAVYVGNYHAISGFSGWKRLYATSVADSSGTVTLPEGVTGSISYKVINGVCYVSIRGLADGLTGLEVVNFTGLPKADVYISISIENSGNYAGTIYSVDGVTFYVHKSVSGGGYGSFSYPVAER